METKVCTKCGLEFPIYEFNWRNKKNGTRRSECKYCHSSYMRTLNTDKRNLVSKIKSQIKCQKCGESRSYVLDFHHLDPNVKEATVARMVSNTYSIEKVMDEIKKCIVFCSNCHREFHYLNENYGIALDDYLENNFQNNQS